MTFCMLFLLVAFIGLWKLSSSRRFQLIGKMATRVETPQKQVALTFDDGPTPAYTSWVIELLRQKKVHATFFVTGRETTQNVSAARALVAAGHDLGNHSYSHPRMIFKSPVFIAREIEDTDAAIRAAGWEGKIAFRPPYGKRLFVLPWYLKNHQRATVLWDVEPESYPGIVKDPRAIARHVLERVKPGSIVLLHIMYKSREASRQALPLIIDGLQTKGYDMVTLSELQRSGQK